MVCGKETYDAVICYDCSQTEKDKQRSQPGSITEKQFGYIEHLLMKIGKYRIFLANSDRFMMTVIPDYEHLEDITANQAGELISSLLSISNNDPADGLTWRGVDTTTPSEDSEIVRKVLSKESD
jgi:hypothetical protein